MFAVLVNAVVCVQVHVRDRKQIKRCVRAWRKAQVYEFCKTLIILSIHCDWPKILPVLLSFEKKNSITIQVELNSPRKQPSSECDWQVYERKRRVSEWRRGGITDSDKTDRKRKEKKWCDLWEGYSSACKTKKQTNKQKPQEQIKKLNIHER